MIQELVPGARIGVGHGQMGEAELEKTMLQFMRHEFDILVCTTIIENGLDIPLANTMIVENAERYGLPSCTSCGTRGPIEPPRLRLPAGAARYGTDARSPASGWRR